MDLKSLWYEIATFGSFDDDGDDDDNDDGEEDGDDDEVPHTPTTVPLDST